MIITVHSSVRKKSRPEKREEKEGEREKGIKNNDLCIIAWEKVLSTQLIIPQFNHHTTNLKSAYMNIKLRQQVHENHNQMIQQG